MTRSEAESAGFSEPLPTYGTSHSTNATSEMSYGASSASSNKPSNSEKSPLKGVLRRHDSWPLFSEHLGSHRQYWRDIILGVNDGIISTFLLVMGVAGGGMPVRNILLTSIAGALAGGISMAAGEFVATKSQDEVLSGETELEKEHILTHRQEEVRELDILLDKIGFPPEGHADDLRQKVKDYYENSDDALLKIMVALEFGVLEAERRNPFSAAAFSGFLFVSGALPSIIPFMVSDDARTGVFAAGMATAVALIIVGAIKTLVTRGSCINASVENLLIAGIGALFSYLVGLIFDKIMTRYFSG